MKGCETELGLATCEWFKKCDKMIVPMNVLESVLQNVFVSEIVLENVSKA